MADGFKVDLGALESAASGITETLAKLQFKKVSDLDPRKEDIGHAHLADVLEKFCTRWELGVENLAKDARTVSPAIEPERQGLPGGRRSDRGTPQRNSGP